MHLIQSRQLFLLLFGLLAHWLHPFEFTSPTALYNALGTGKAVHSTSVTRHLNDIL